MSGPVSYEKISRGYSGQRRTDPRIAMVIWAALGDADTVLNVGAGTGSYEPPDRAVIAVEPSGVMRAQRPPGAAPCIAAEAEALPFADASLGAALAVLSDHHWRDPIRGLREMQRVAKRIVVFQWDDAQLPRYWLIRDYLPQVAELAANRPSLTERAHAIGASMQPILIPWDCVDGFFHAYWRRPEAYLRQRVRRGTSVWTRVGAQAERRAVAALRADLESGAWRARNAELFEFEQAEVELKSRRHARTAGRGGARNGHVAGSVLLGGIMQP